MLSKEHDFAHLGHLFPVDKAEYHQRQNITSQDFSWSDMKIHVSLEGGIWTVCLGTTTRSSLGRI